MDTQRMTRWQNEIDELTRLYQQRFGGLSAQELNWKPAPDTWSIGQIIDHVIRINETYYPVVEEVRRGGYRVPLLGKFSFVTNFLGNFILKSVEPERRRKMKTFPVWEPTQSDVPPDIVTRFASHQDTLKQFIRDSADLIDEDVVISSPANRNIVYQLDKAFDIIITHERRHFNQAEETLALLRTQE